LNLSCCENNRFLPLAYLQERDYLFMMMIVADYLVMLSDKKIFLHRLCSKLTFIIMDLNCVCVPVCIDVDLIYFAKLFRVVPKRSCIIAQFETIALNFIHNLFHCCCCWFSLWIWKFCEKFVDICCLILERPLPHCLNSAQ
jgi:hypothetical protein